MFSFSTSISYKLYIYIVQLEAYKVPILCILFVIISTFHLCSFAEQLIVRAAVRRVQGVRCIRALAHQGRLAIKKMEQVGKAYVFR